MGGKCQRAASPPPSARRCCRRLRRHVGDDLPVRRGGDGQLVAGLHVRLVEAGVDPVRVEGLQVRVQVDAPVGGIGEPVQSLAAVRVGARGRHPEHVAGRQPGQRDPVAVERVQADRLVVQGDLVDRGRGQVEERGRPGRRAAEPDHADRAERLLVTGQVEVHLVGGDRDERRARRRLVAGQVRSHRVAVPSAEFWPSQRSRSCSGRLLVRPYPRTRRRLIPAVRLTAGGPGLSVIRGLACVAGTWAVPPARRPRPAATAAVAATAAAAATAAVAAVDAAS